MAKKEKLQYPNPKIWKCKDNIDWKAQAANLKEVGGIFVEMLKETDWKAYGARQKYLAKQFADRVKEEFQAVMALDAAGKREVRE